jgi:succinate dehydrogenase/fumarate reductase flavoprotein subunit
MGIQQAAVTGFIAGENAARHAVDTRREEIDAAYAGKIVERVKAPAQRKVALDASVVAYRVHEAVVPMKYNRQREADRIKEALGIVQDAREKLSRVGAADFHDLARYHSAESMVMAAEFTYRAALMREESRAGHFREDFPQRDDKNWFKWITIQQKYGKPQLSTLPVPLDSYRIKPE